MVYKCWNKSIEILKTKRDCIYFVHKFKNPCWVCNKEILFVDSTGDSLGKK